MTLVCQHCQHPPTFKHREQQQQPYLGMWQALVAWERDAHDRGDPIYPQQLRAEIVRIVDQQPEPADTFALNTTRYGREGIDA